MFLWPKFISAHTGRYVSVHPTHGTSQTVQELTHADPGLGTDPTGHHLLTHQEHARLLPGAHTGAQGQYALVSHIVTCRDGIHTAWTSLWFEVFTLLFNVILSSASLLFCFCDCSPWIISSSSRPDEGQWHCRLKSNNPDLCSAIFPPPHVYDWSF